MKLTRYCHACILVEQDGINVLFDPGAYSADILQSSQMPKLDYLIITHEHFDHFNPEVIAKLVNGSPAVNIISTSTVVAKLQSLGLKASTAASGPIELFTAPHEKIPYGPGPDNIGVHFKAFSHPGDSYAFTSSREVMALPTAGPWASITRAVDLAIELKPKHVVPIHDWPLRPEVASSTYESLVSVFDAAGIKLHIPKDGQTFTI